MSEDLTPDAIVDYPLRTGMRGYRVDQVDELLDRVADRVERLQRQLAERDAELGRVRAQLEDAASAEETLTRTLVTAERAAEETRSAAEAEAEEITAAAREEAAELVEQARREAEELRTQAARDVDRIQRDGEVASRDAELRLTQLKGAAERFRTQLQEHLDAHQALLEEVPQPPGEPTPRAPDAAGVGDADPAPDPASAPSGSGPATPLFPASPRPATGENSRGTDDDD